MSTAQVRSLESLPDFRAALWEFQAAARQALDMVEVEARHGVEWVTIDRARFWKHENRKAWDNVSQAKDNLRQARIQRQVAGYTPDCIDEKKALARAEKYLKLTEQKLHSVQTWAREAQHAWNEFQARFSQTLGALDGDLPRAIAVLERIIRQLEEYLTTRAPDLELSQSENTASNASVSNDAVVSIPTDKSVEDVDSAVVFPLNPTAESYAAAVPIAAKSSAAANHPPTYPR